MHKILDATLLNGNSRAMTQRHDLPDKLRVRVTPKARFERVRKESGPDGSVVYKVHVTAAPEDGKANKAMIKLLAKALGVAKSSLTITHGHTSRDKIVKIGS